MVDPLCKIYSIVHVRVCYSIGKSMITVVSECIQFWKTDLQFIYLQNALSYVHFKCFAGLAFPVSLSLVPMDSLSQVKFRVWPVI